MQAVSDASRLCESSPGSIQVDPFDPNSASTSAVLEHSSESSTEANTTAPDDVGDDVGDFVTPIGHEADITVVNDESRDTEEGQMSRDLKDSDSDSDKEDYDEANDEDNDSENEPDGSDS